VRRPFTTYFLAFIFLILAACQTSNPRPTATNVALPTATDMPPTAVSTAAIATEEPTTTPTETVEATETPISLAFDGDSAYVFLLEQMEFGPRFPGSPGHEEVGDYIVEQLSALSWEVEEQTFPYQDITGRNIIGRANEGVGPVIILGAHYDTRAIADQTPDSAEPVPGAVDGASGVAVLLELARTLDLDLINREIWLAFFDVEDNGNNGLPGYDWIVGSTYMAENLTIEPEAMILVDMIGDADQQLYYEGNSDQELQARIWAIAAELGYEAYFIQELKYTMIDDHLPFAERGIPAVDIIDFDYPYWHTVDDTADKASPESLLRVGRTLEVWLETGIDG
jgi:glutaminyl-peptide cyclotransferase